MSNNGFGYVQCGILKPLSCAFIANLFSCNILVFSSKSEFTIADVACRLFIFSCNTGDYTSIRVLNVVNAQLSKVRCRQFCVFQRMNTL